MCLLRFLCGAFEGRISEVVSALIFVVLLLLMGKGYTITRGRISTGGSIKIAIFMTLYAVTYGVLFFYQAMVSAAQRCPAHCPLCVFLLLFNGASKAKGH